MAADFKHAKKTYVPPTTIERRLDFNSLRERVAQAYKTTSPASSQGGKASPNQTSVDQKVDTLLTNLTNISLTKAKKFLLAKKLDEAAQVLREGLFCNPASSELAKLLNNTLRQAGIDPASSDERLKLADILSSQSKDIAATVEYRACLKLKDNPKAHIGLGNIAARLGQKRLAITEYQKAVEIDPSSWVALRQMGLLKHESGDLIGANLDLSRAVCLAGKDKIAGQALIELWQHQVSRAPYDVNNHLGLARAYQLTGDLRSAQSEYKQAVRMDPENPSLPAARESFKLALTQQEIERTIEAARALESQGAIGEALGKVAQAKALNPHNSQVCLYEGQLMEKLGQQSIVNPPQSCPKTSATDDTGRLSSFLLSLRNHTLCQKKSIENIEHQAHQALNGIVSSAVLATKPQSAFANNNSSALATTSTSSIAHSLRDAATDTGSTSQAASTETGPFSISSLLTIPNIETAYQKLMSLEKQNEDLKQKLLQAQSIIVQLQNWAGKDQAPITQSPNTQSIDSPPVSPNPSPVQVASLATPQTQNTTLSRAVRLELEGFSPATRGGLQLKVVLRNDQDVPLTLPANTTAVIRGTRTPETKVKVSFPDTVVQAHGQLRGTIKVPKHNIDPAADLYLPDVLPAGIGERSLHLTVPVSWRTP
ncbi:MAG: tetratricopeptide repeat protein [Candidatus Melainabacteria bacterium]|nr:tetratricopeptide repeat protein [Candidatus Melainabacteria bacterium]